MREADINAALRMWEDQGAQGLPLGDIERALRRLPESGICAVSDDAAELFMLGPTDTLFTVSADGGTVTVRSRPLDTTQLIVELRLAEGRSLWTFRYTGSQEARERWQSISGSVATAGESGEDHPDDREQFARALAERAGWGQGARGPSAKEPPAGGPPEDPGPSEPRWRARTDVWGRPLDVSGR
jgi:hypothetical protein